MAENQADVKKEAPVNEILAFLMVGQSNMAGRGVLSDVDAIKNDRCLMFRMAKWQPMSEPINIDRALGGSLSPGVGLAASFADELAKHSGRRIGLIPCAHGGTKIESWLPGEVLFDNAVFTTKLSLRHARLGGIIWHQGENNCGDLNEEDYKKKFLRTMTELRRELSCEDLPLIVGEIPEKMCERPELNVGDAPIRFNAMLREVIKELPRCAVASQEGLTMKPDGVHFDAASYRIFGKRYFEKYLEIVGE